MNKFSIIFSKPSKDDIDDLANYIIGNCKSPKTAADYTQGILKKIKSLETLPILCSCNRKITV